MNITEYKSLYQDYTAFFGVRNGILYSGNLSADGTPIYHYGVVYQGLGTAQEKCRLSLGPYLALAAMVNNYARVEAPVMYSSMRGSYPTQLMWGFDLVKGFEDPRPIKMRGTNMQTLESGELTVVPRNPGNILADATIGQMPMPGIRYSDRHSMHYTPYSTQATTGSTQLTFRSNGQTTSMVADVIPLEGSSRFASLTYATENSVQAGFELKYFKVFDTNPASGAMTEVGKVQMNSANDQARCHVGYGIPLDESLIERDASGNATAYHLIYGKYQAAQGIPGKLIYKKIGLRPFVEPADEVVLEDINTGTWPILPTAQTGDAVVKIEGRSFIYSHAGVRYLVVFYKMGRHAVTGFTPIPFTIKRAVLTDGVAGPFETITFPVPFADWGCALLLSPDRKTMWHFPYTGVKVACLSFAADVRMESQEYAFDTYISAAGVDNDQCLIRTDVNGKYVIRPGEPAPLVTLAFDKAQYAIGSAAVLTVTTSATAPITVTIEVTGATVKSFTKTLSASAPATIPLTVTGVLQAVMVK